MVWVYEKLRCAVIKYNDLDLKKRWEKAKICSTSVLWWAFHIWLTAKWFLWNCIGHLFVQRHTQAVWHSRFIIQFMLTKVAFTFFALALEKIIPLIENILIVDQKKNCNPWIIWILVLVVVPHMMNLQKEPSFTSVFNVQQTFAYKRLREWHNHFNRNAGMKKKVIDFLTCYRKTNKICTGSFVFFSNSKCQNARNILRIRKWREKGNNTDRQQQQ